jgi:hypothetical protein
MAVAVVLYLLSLVILYWIIRFAVAHGTGDALRRDRMLNDEISRDIRTRESV